MRFIIVFMLASLLVPQGSFSKASIPDIFEVSQDLNFYVDRTTATKAQISRLAQEKLDQRFNEAFFRPWRDGFSPQGPKVARQRIDKYEKKSGYGENQKKHGPKWADAFAVNADLKTYPNARIEGIEFVHFSEVDVVRHPLVQEVVRAYDVFEADKRARAERPPPDGKGER